MKTVISFFIFLFLLLNCSIDRSIANCSILQCAVSPQMICINADNQNIAQLMKQSVEYEWWSNKQNYRKELSQFYTDPALENITESIARYKEANTDWYSLTFLENCHIVYNNGNIAIVIAYLKDTDITTNDTQQGRGVFILDKTNDGWRIKDMDCYWYSNNIQLLDREVNTLWA